MDLWVDTNILPPYSEMLVSTPKSTWRIYPEDQIDNCIRNPDSEIIFSKKKKKKKKENLLNGTESIKDLLKSACVITEFLQI
jgi:hypothetical protein